MKEVGSVSWRSCAFCLDQQELCKGSMIGNDKIYAAKKRTMRQERRERRKRDATVMKMARVQSMTSVQTQKVMKMSDDTKVEVGDEGNDEAQDPLDPRDMHRKEVAHQHSLPHPKHYCWQRDGTPISHVKQPGLSNNL